MAIIHKSILKRTESGQSYLSLIRNLVSKYDPNLRCEEEMFEGACNTLVKILSSEQVSLMQQYLDAEYIRLSNNLKRIIEWGADDYYQCLENHLYRDFMYNGFEEIINEDYLSSSYESAYADQIGHDFFISLQDDETDDLAGKLIDYYCYIETVWYKFAHFAGFAHAAYTGTPAYRQIHDEMETLVSAYGKEVEDYLGFRIFSA